VQLKEHIVFSIPAAAAAVYMAGFRNGLLFMTGAVLWDVDHIFDYIFINKKKWNFSRFQRDYYEHSVEKTLLVLHSWEILLLLFLASSLFLNKGLFFMAGALYHLVLDSLFNPCRPYAYFLLHRLRKGLKFSELYYTREKDR